MNIKDNFNNIEYIIMKVIRTTLGFIMIGLFIYVISLFSLAQGQETLYEDQSEFNENYNYTVEYEPQYKSPLEECKILHDGPNIKIIDMMLFTNTINSYCMAEMDKLLNNLYTIQGTLKDRYLILESNKDNK